MNKRIRYIKTGESGILKSFRNILSHKTGALYSITLDLNEVTYKIKNVRNGHIVKRGGDNVNNLHVLKRYIKKDLKGLGVKFELELRDRNYGRTEKKEAEKND